MEPGSGGTQGTAVGLELRSGCLRAACELPASPPVDAGGPRWLLPEVRTVLTSKILASFLLLFSSREALQMHS